MPNSSENSKKQIWHEALGKIFSAEQIKTDAESLLYFGKDWTTYYNINASAIVFPETTEQVQKLVKLARTHKIGLVPSGGRTGLSGGACATQGEIVVSFVKMNRILDFNSIEQTVVCQPGVVTEELQKWAAAKDLFYPVDFAARGSSQIGGNIATNAGGIKVLRYGMTRNWVTGLKVVTGTGELIELNNSLIKNATGYDLRHLMIGSEGTLGFIVEATMQLTTPPPECKVMVLGVESLDSIMKIFSEFQKRLTLSAFEMFSELALSKVLEQTQLPRPFSTACPYYVLAEVECPHSESESQILSAFEFTLEQGWVIDGALSQSAEQGKNFWRLREDISESLAKFSPYKNDISVSISKVPELMNKLDIILKKAYPTWEVVWFGHVGDGNLHINILRPQGMAKEMFVKECQQVDVMVFESVRALNGAISAEHGVGLSKKSFLNFTRSAAEINLMKSIKLIFDPDQIVNPGKVFDF